MMTPKNLRALKEFEEEIHPFGVALGDAAAQVLILPKYRERFEHQFPRVCTEALTWSAIFDYIKVEIGKHPEVWDIPIQSIGDYNPDFLERISILQPYLQDNGLGLLMLYVLEKILLPKFKQFAKSIGYDFASEDEAQKTQAHSIIRRLFPTVAQNIYDEYIYRFAVSSQIEANKYYRRSK